MTLAFSAGLSVPRNASMAATTAGVVSAPATAVVAVAAAALVVVAAATAFFFVVVVAFLVVLVDFFVVVAAAAERVGEPNAKATTMAVTAAVRGAADRDFKAQFFSRLTGSSRWITSLYEGLVRRLVEQTPSHKSDIDFRAANTAVCGFEPGTETTEHQSLRSRDSSLGVRQRRTDQEARPAHAVKSPCHREPC